MPYKFIAGHLRKAGLACRLHYHQMSYGNCPRWHAGSTTSSTTSFPYPPLYGSLISAPRHVLWLLPPARRRVRVVAKSTFQPESSRLPAPILMLASSVPTILPPMRSVSLKLAENRSLENGNLVSALTAKYDIDVGCLRGIYNKYSGTF